MWSDPLPVKSTCCLPSSMNVSGGFCRGPICEYQSGLPVCASHASTLRGREARLRELSRGDDRLLGIANTVRGEIRSNPIISPDGRRLARADGEVEIPSTRRFRERSALEPATCWTRHLGAVPKQRYQCVGDLYYAAGRWTRARHSRCGCKRSGRYWMNGRGA